MRRVLKWQLDLAEAGLAGHQQIGGGKVVKVASQDGVNLVVWTLEQVDDDGHPVGAGARTVRIYGNGDGIPDGWDHLGSVIVMRGKYVWHVFEEVHP